MKVKEDFGSLLYFSQYCAAKFLHMLVWHWSVFKLRIPVCCSTWLSQRDVNKRPSGEGHSLHMNQMTSGKRSEKYSTKWLQCTCHLMMGQVQEVADCNFFFPLCVLQARLNCKHCGKPVVDVRVGMQYFSEYSNVQQCPHCGNLDYHFVKPFSSFKVLEAYWRMLSAHARDATLCFSAFFNAT